jgi:hypothetical protein
MVVTNPYFLVLSLQKQLSRNNKIAEQISYAIVFLFKIEEISKLLQDELPGL